MEREAINSIFGAAKTSRIGCPGLGWKGLFLQTLVLSLKCARQLEIHFTLFCAVVNDNAHTEEPAGQ
jgi:hypothetical protein